MIFLTSPLSQRFNISCTTTLVLRVTPTPSNITTCDFSTYSWLKHLQQLCWFEMNSIWKKVLSSQNTNILVPLNMLVQSDSEDQFLLVSTNDNR